MISFSMPRYLPSLAILVTMALCYSHAEAASISVSPVRIFLEPGKRAEMLTIRNNGTEDTDLQLRIYSWSQDTKGEDAYTETREVVVFPKMVKVPKGEERIVRIGRKTPAGKEEASFRLYIQELPRKSAPGPQVKLSMLIRMGIPVFLLPSEVRPDGVIDGIAMDSGMVSVRLKNAGNRHVQVSSVQIRGKDRNDAEKFQKDIGGWYLLGGASRTYATQIASELCRDLSRIEVEVRTDQFALKGKLDVDRSMCPQ